MFVSREEMIKSTVSEVLEEKRKASEEATSVKQEVIVEFSSPNIAKPFHIGHIRVDSYRVLRKQDLRCAGYDVFRQSPR